MSFLTRFAEWFSGSNNNEVTDIAEKSKDKTGTVLIVAGVVGVGIGVGLYSLYRTKLDKAQSEKTPLNKANDFVGGIAATLQR